MVGASGGRSLEKCWGVYFHWRCSRGWTRSLIQYTYTQTYIHKYIHTYVVHTYMHACIRAYIHTWHVYIHTYKHTYRHTYILHTYTISYKYISMLKSAGVCTCSEDIGLGGQIVVVNRVYGYLGRVWGSFDRVFSFQKTWIPSNFQMYWDTCMEFCFVSRNSSSCLSYILSMPFAILGANGAKCFKKPLQ